jgi:mitochondrial import inner membrane translocase subunit TIM23
MDEARSFEHLQKPIGRGSLFDEEPDYLEYNYKGRPYYEKLFFNSGLAYAAGSFAGAMFGAARGFASSPSDKFRVKVNGLLNGAGKYGSRGGNNMGVLALYYTTFEKLIDMSGIDEASGEVVPYFNQISAGACTGMLFKCMSRPTTVLVAGAVGGFTLGITSYAESLWNSRRY